MKNYVFVYDNRNEINDTVRKIVALNSYGDIIYKRKKLKNKMQSAISDLFPDATYFTLNRHRDIESLLTSLEGKKNSLYIHIYSSTVITNLESFQLFLSKCNYVDEVMITDKNNPTCLIFPNEKEYREFLKNEDIKNPEKAVENYPNLPEMSDMDSLESINKYDTFLKFFSGGFEARHFNSVVGDEYIVTKTSQDKKKIKAEHDYYYLLPPAMKRWFVVPFDYEEDENTASYSMERVEVPDLALQWVHEALNLSDFEKLLDTIFFFVNTRAKKEVTAEERNERMINLYQTKVVERIEKLKAMKEYEQLETLIKLGTDYQSIDEIYKKYDLLFQKIILKYPFANQLVIGHGDLCFSNMLYYKDINLLKLIDVKGATTEDQLWTDTYYDLAKLSHSICGNYDFFNYDMVDICLGLDCKLSYRIEKRDTTPFVELFRNKLEQNGYDYRVVRLFEASLFLSMLPLHIDNPKKVYGFILNAVSILKEVENYES